MKREVKTVSILACKVTVKFYGRFKELIGGSELSINVENNVKLMDLLLRIGKMLNGKVGELVLNGRVAPGVLVFINGVDYELLGGVDAKVSCGDVVAVIPVVHGG